MVTVTKSIIRLPDGQNVLFHDMPARIKALYEKFPQSRYEFENEGNLFLDFLSQIPDELDMDEEQNFAHQCLEEMLHFLPGDKIVEEFGEDILRWGYLKFSSGYIRDYWEKQLQMYTSINTRLWEKARISQHKLHGTRTFSWSKFAYDFFHKALDSPIASYDIDFLLHKCAKNTLSEKRILDYDIEYLMPEKTYDYGYEHRWGRPLDDGTYFGVYMDAPFGFSLIYKGFPNCIIGFYPLDTNTIFVNQLQGVVLKDHNGKSKVVGSRGLAPLDWERFMTEFISEWAIENGFSKLVIQEGAKNKWTKPIDGKPAHMTLESACKRYDGVTQRLGFERAANGDWFKDLYPFVPRLLTKAL